MASLSKFQTDHDKCQHMHMENGYKYAWVTDSHFILAHPDFQDHCMLRLAPQCYTIMINNNYCWLANKHLINKKLIAQLT